jgi:hypothetical protein
MELYDPKRGQLTIGSVATEVKEILSRKQKIKPRLNRLRGYFDMKIQNCPSLLPLSIGNYSNLFQEQSLLEQYIQLNNQSLPKIDLQLNHRNTTVKHLHHQKPKMIKRVSRSRKSSPLPKHKSAFSPPRGDSGCYPV